MTFPRATPGGTRSGPSIHDREGLARPLVALIEEQRPDARADRFPLTREHEEFIRESERAGDGDARAGGTAPGPGENRGPCLLSCPLSGFSRTLGDPGPPRRAATHVFQGILGHSGPEKGCLHRKCGRTAIWRGSFEAIWRHSPAVGQGGIVSPTYVPRGVTPRGGHRLRLLQPAKPGADKTSPGRSPTWRRWP